MRVCFLFCALSVFSFAETVGVVGTGYVGLVLAEVLAQCGHQIVCIDQDQEKIDQLNQGIVPIFEPGLTSLFSGSISFSSQIKSLEGVAALFICVGTPSNERGECDCTAIYQVLAQVSQMDRPPSLICIKSTLAPGTIKRLEEYLGPSSPIAQNLAKDLPLGNIKHGSAKLHMSIIMALRLLDLAPISGILNLA